MVSYDVVFESCFSPSFLNFVYSGATLKLLSAQVNWPGLGIYRSPKAAVLVRPSTIDPSHTIMGCDLLSRTEQIHRWLLKCPTGQHLASFLAYGGPSRPPYIHPSQALGAQTLTFRLFPSTRNVPLFRLLLTVTYPHVAWEYRLIFLMFDPWLKERGLGCRC